MFEFYNMTTTTIKEFYDEMFGEYCPEVLKYVEEMDKKDVGHFNVFDISDMYGSCKAKPVMPYNRRTYYKISLIKGKNKVEYADKTIEIDDFAILFATPKIPYRYTPQDNDQKGHFCVFTGDFMTKSKTGLMLDELPIYQPNTDFIFQLNQKQYEEIEAIFIKMHNEIRSEYQFKYDLLRNYVIELLHNGQKLKPMDSLIDTMNASSRITSLFLELLERQFPIESSTQSLLLRNPKDYAETLNVHVNHLNKTLKERTGKTTTEIITSRILQESKILLKNTTWNVSEISNSLGFEEVAHFSNFFKKQSGLSPLAFRN
ncbi:MAG TPA: helix-turn-helix transcriptional regulator [Flavobacterium sp.]|nr:helix-turn-helix transcriptional regulator [Flavobacterium sp.]